MSGSTITLALSELEALAVDVLFANRTSGDNAAQVAAAIAAAEADGLKGHGASRLPFYAAQAKSGKVDGNAVPQCAAAGTAGLRIDARQGFAYPALNLAVTRLGELAAETGVAAAAIANSHHAGAAGYPVERLARAGLVGLFFANSPQAIAPWGGDRALFGTNPIAFAAPRRTAPPLLIDMSTSRVARGRIMNAARDGTPIPEDWAFDANGQPTTDPKAAMAGTMRAMGDAKGTQLVLMVELFAAALSGSNFGFEASSFFEAQGPAPRTGQFLIAIDPDRFAGGGFAERMETIVGAILDQPGTRLPGLRRFDARAAAQRDGVTLPAALHAEIVALTQPGTGSSQ
jgi:(2R)-3-sulfolactate dehydrogenase (NADP+)